MTLTDRLRHLLGFANPAGPDVPPAQLVPPEVREVRAARREAEELRESSELLRARVALLEATEQNAQP